MITIPKNILKAAFLFASKDTAREILNAIQVKKVKHGAIVTATDGRRLITIRSTQIIMDEDELKLLRFPISSDRRVDTIEISRETVRKQSRLFTGDILIPEASGVYPKWKVMFSGVTKTSTTALHCNPEFLADFGRASRLLCGEPFVTVVQQDGGAFLVKSANDTTDISWRGMFMPIRPYGDTEDVPNWIKEME